MLDMFKEIEVCCKHRNRIKANEIRENKLLSLSVFTHFVEARMRASSDWYEVFVVTNLNIRIVCILNIVVLKKAYIVPYDCIFALLGVRVTVGYWGRSSDIYQYAGKLLFCPHLNPIHKGMLWKQDVETAKHAKSKNCVNL